MKKVILCLCCLLAYHVYAQVTPTLPTPTATATSANGSPVFWSRTGNTIASPNNIFGFAGLPGANNNNIWFQTNGYNRMLLNKGGNLTNDGQLAIGNDLPGTFVPQARLHLHQTAPLGTGNFDFIRFTTNTTLATATDGFAAGINANGFTFFTNFENDQPLTWFTEDISGTGLVSERMRLNADNFNGFTAIGNTANFNANAQLHINNIGLTTGGLGAAAYGNLLQTDGTGTNNNAWRMFTDFGGLSEKFNLTVPANSNNLRIETNQPGSIMFFRNGPGIDVMQVNSVGPLLSNQNNNVWIRKNVVHPFYDAAFLDIGGPIAFSSAQTPLAINPLIYYNTSSTGVTNDGIRDGFRMLYDFASEGVGNGDCLVFEKTDGQTNQPDGCIKFTNFGADATRRLSMTIEGNGNIGCGAFYNNTLVPWRRFSVADSLGPQLRLHRTFANTIFGEIFTDFETTANGDMQIDPRQAGVGTPGNTGVVRINYGLGNGAPDPDLSLDVNGQENIRTVNQDNTLNQFLVWEPISGNVRWSNAIAGFGQNCGAFGNPGALTQSRELPMDGFNFYFEGQTVTGENSVGIGYSFCPTLPAKLSVIETGVGANPIAIQGVAVGGTTSVGGDFSSSGGSSTSIGVRGSASGGPTLIAGQFRCAGGTTSTYGLLASGNGGDNAYGIRAIAGGGTQNWGGHFYADGGSTSSVGVFAQSPVLATFNWALVADGDVYMNGTTTSLGWVPSDPQFKTNIDTLHNALATINQLQPKSFYYDTLNSNGFNFPSEKSYGFLTTDVEQILPELVSLRVKPATYDTLGNVLFPAHTFKALNYNAFFGIYAKGIQELNSAIVPFITPPNAPILVSPSNGASGDFHKTTLVWNSVPGSIIYYHVQLSKDSSFTTNIIVDQSRLTDTIVGISPSDSATYYWRVNARNNAGLSPWSDVFAFTNTNVEPPKKSGTFESSTLSDSTLKQNITPLTGSLDKVKQLYGVNYHWNTSANTWLTDTTAQIGMIATEVKNIYPEVVYQDDSSFYHIDYQHLVPPVVESIKELAFNDSIKTLQIQALQQQNDDLQEQINDMMAAINNCCNQGNSSLQTPNGNNTNGNGNNTTYDSNTKINSQDVKLAENNICILNTNSPNPFNDKTIITYRIPLDARVAQIIFYNMLGEVIKVVDINEKGEGRLNVFGEDLRSGMYSYTLIIDGNVCETKKMIKE